MATRPSTMVGVFNDSTAAERAIDALRDAGFSNDQLRYSGPAGGAGGFWQSVKSLFSDTDTTSSNMVNDLMGLGLSQDEATYYAREHEKGHPIVAVNPAGHEEDAWQIFQRTGAQTYSAGSTGEMTSAGTYGQSTGGYTQPDYGQAADTTRTDQYAQPGYDQTVNTAQTNQYAQPGTYTQPDQYNQPATGYSQTDQYGRSADYTDTGDVDEEGRRKVRLREERLQADKQPVESGEVRLRKDIVTEQKNIDVPVSHEEVYVERQGVQERPSDAPIGEGETFRVPVREEQVNVTKTPVETGEVTLGKRTVQDTQRVSDTVRREEARVEQAGDVPVRDQSGNDIVNNPNEDLRNP